MFLLFQKSANETEINGLAILYNKALESIPDAYLSDSFEYASKSAKFFPKPAHILESWDKVRMDIPKEQDSEPEQRPNYLLPHEKEKLQEVYEKYPGFRDYLDSLDIENDPNGTDYKMPSLQSKHSKTWRVEV